MIIRKLPEICEIKTGKKDANHANPSGKYRFYTCASQYSMCDTFSFSGESIIVPGNGDIGLVFYYNGDFEAYQRTYVLNNIMIFPKYLYYHLVYKWRHINSDKQYGSTVRYVRMSNFTSYELPVPSLDEQERVVARIEELFSELDNGVETLRKTKQQLAVYRQAVISAAFPEMTEENTVRLDEIADISGGITKGRDLSKQETVHLPYLRVANVQNGYLDLSQMKTIELKVGEKEKYLLRSGDVLYTEGGDRDKLGRGTVWNDEIPNCVHQNHVFKARLDLNKANPRYVAYWSMSAFARNYFYNKGKQSVNLASINKTVLSALTLPLPSLPEQEATLREIESRLSVCDSIEKTVDTALQQAEAMRQSILKQAFGGGL